MSLKEMENVRQITNLYITFQDKLKSSNHASEGYSSLVAEQIDRAPIIVSTNNQSDATTSTKGKDICKNNRSVIVRAGTVSVSTVIFFVRYIKYFDVCSICYIIIFLF